MGDKTKLAALREAIGHIPAFKTPRKGMSPARRKRILEANGNVCAYEGCEITKGLELDHPVPLALGGPDDDERMIPLCYDHHKEKTRRDIWQIAKAKRQAKMDEPREEPSRFPSRPFPKSTRPLQSRGFDKRPKVTA